VGSVTWDVQNVVCGSDSSGEFRHMQSTESVVWCRTLQVSSITCSLQNPLCGVGLFR
jgi:hypothetical protein